MFERNAADADIGDVFDRDITAEVAAIRRLNLDLIEASMQHASARLDNSAVVAASVGGAIGGALAAIIVSLV